MPVIGVVCHETVDYHHVGKTATEQVLAEDDGEQPDPLVPLHQEDGIHHVHDRAQEHPCHGDVHEGFPTIVIAPAAKIEGQEDGDGVPSCRDVVVEGAHLPLYVTVLGGVGVLLEIATELLATGENINKLI